MKRLAAALLLFVGPVLSASTFRFDPPVPDNVTTTKLTLTAQWPDACPIAAPEVGIDNDLITIAFPHAALPCAAVVTPFSRTVNLGVLPAGVYHVQARINIGDPPYPLGTTTLVVRDVATYTVTPATGEIGGGTHLRIAGTENFDVEPLHVSVDGTEVAVMRIDAKTIEIVTPPHAAGPVDILVQSVMGGTHLAKAAFTYFDPRAATPDPFVFTALLFPIDFAGDGAFGAQWMTDNVLEIDGEKTKLPLTGSPSGVVLPVPRSATVAANSRIRDLSRSSQSAGTEVPVVHESDFREGARLLNVPTGNHFRALLRVWTSGEPANSFFLNIDQIPTFAVQTAPLQPAQGGLRYGTYDLTPFMTAPPDHLDIHVGVLNGSRVWAMISVTNNETQQVTIISP